MGKIKFFVCSVGEPNKDYTKDNLNRCVKFNGHFMHQDTKQKGAFYSVNKGDIVFLKHNKRIIAFGQVSLKESDDYNKYGEWNYIIRVYEWFFYDKNDLNKGANIYGLNEATLDGNQYSTIKEIDKYFAIKTMNEIDPNNNLLRLIKNYINMEDYLLDIQNLLVLNHNLILTGAPGTGKTYLAKKIAKEITQGTNQLMPIEILKTAINGFVSNESINTSNDNLLRDFNIRFPKEKLKEMTLNDYCIGKGEENKDNFCYWIERKLKPVGYYFPGSSESYLIYWNKKENDYRVHGYLKRLATDDIVEKMKILAQDIHDMVNNDNPDNYTEKFGVAFMLKILNTYYPEKYAPINSPKHIDNIISMFNIHCDSKNVIKKNKAVYDFYRTTCNGKNINIFEFMNILYNNFNIKDGETLTTTGVLNNSGRWLLVQFHPSYDYTDFVEGLRPIKEEGSKEIGFVRKDGIFKELCVEAKKNPNKNYVLIIDEINRGEISKIFGELFFSIDPGYRGEDGRVKTQYQNLVKDDDEFYDGFYVPKNIYIIGTMNDIDRSVESMDFAFRRRFAFKEIKADDRIAMLDELAWKDDAINRIQRINARIDKIDGLSRAYHIGPAYFLKLENYDGDFDLLWENHLEGLLLEYMRGMNNNKEEIKELAKIYGYTKMDRYE